ncbi:DUF11 domain-containing protein [Glaciibacter flavus]|uniref:DUF11 domain-containing protein n=1 Tax=Orlajensenia flava TaxID=2565934 RepID=A0A4S4FLK5_9MICO|nr:DUF11 domain-containing protein [Glaciibacter flavus]THG31343.1 DUF11 domain-containing protein [Glaciibacter flavus]
MSRRVRSFLAAIAALATALVLVGLTQSATGLSITPFGVRFQTNDNGAIAVIGNQLQTCPTDAPNCVGARAGSARYNNNSFVMTNLDVDADPTTFNSSSAQLDVPSGGTVLWAGLYWGARLSAGTGGTAATGDRRTMSFKVPGAAGYQSISSQVTFGPTTSSDRAYQEFADVTALVRGGGGGDYWGANVRGGTGEDRYAGWSLAVVYRSPDLPLRNLTVFDGFADVGQGEPQTVTASGFLAPLSGPVDTQIGMVAYEGDFSASGDSVALNTTQLGTAISPGTNFFNGSNDRNGVSVTTRNPADRNMLGFDVKQLGASGVIPNGATSADFRFTSSGDRYFPGVLTTAINLFAPDFTPSSKSVVDLTGNSPAQPGDRLQYTVNVTNVGQDPADRSVLSDPLPPNITYVPGSLQVLSGAGTGRKTDAAGDDQAEYDPGGRLVRFRVGTGATSARGGVLAPNGLATVRFEATVDAAAGGATVTNGAQLDYVAQTTGSALTYQVRPVSTPVTALADLAITKTVAPDPALAGGPTTFTITVVNNGPNAASNVVVADPTPAGVTVSGATSTQGDCAISTTPDRVNCAIGTLANGASATITVSGSTDPSSTDPSVTDIATVGSDTADPRPGDNTAGATAQLMQSADLVVTKTADPTTVVPGGTTAYTVTVSNRGPSTATNVTVNDAVSDPSTLVLTGASTVTPGATCAPPSPNATCALPQLLPGQSMTVDLTALLSSAATPGSSIDNVATVSSATPDPRPDDDRAVAPITVAAAQVDLVVSKAAPATVVAGRTLAYSITVANAGLSDATDVVVSDKLPAGIVATSVASTRGSCTSGATVTCSIDALPAGIAGSPGASVTVTIQATVDGDVPAGPIENTASATASQTDVNASNNADTATTTVSAVADLAVTKTATPNPAVAGRSITYTVTVGNDGPSTARGVTLRDLLPPQFAFTSATPSTGTCSPADATGLDCALGDVPNGETRTLVVVMRVPPGYSGTPAAVETVTVASTTDDPNGTNNTASWTATTRASADLSLDKDAPASAASGSQFSYTIHPTNLGPSSASDVVVTDPLPSGVTFVSASPLCTENAGTVTCPLGVLAPGAAPEITITVRVGGNVDIGTLLTNTATVASSTPDPTLADNSATAVTETTALVDLSVTKAATLGSTAPGGEELFTITVGNAGPSTARAVSIVDSFEASALVAYIDGADCSGSSGDLTCTLPAALGPGQSATIQIGVIVSSSLQPGSYANTVQVSTSTPESDPDNNVASITETITAPTADLAIAKTSLTDPLVAGAPFSYRIDVTNTPQTFFGSDASDVVVTDRVPAGLTVTSASPSQGTCTVTAGEVRCDLGVVRGLVSTDEPPPVVITINGMVASNGSQPITNSASVKSTTNDPELANNTAEVTTRVEQQAALSIVKTADTDPIVAGSTAGYTIAVTNSGPSDAAGVVVADLLDPAIAFRAGDSDPSCTPGATGPSCTLGTVPAGQTVTVRVAGILSAASTITALTNTASVTSETTDPDPGDNSSTISTAVVRNADLRLSKTSDSSTPSAGTEVTYALTLTNAGPSDAANTTIVDPLPAGVDLVGLQPFGVTCTSSPAPVVVTCAASGLVAGRAQGVAITVRLPDGLSPGPVLNTATAASATPDSNPADDTASNTVDVQVVADTAITKSVVTDDPRAGQPVAFLLQAVNNGPATAPDTVFTDTLPVGTRLISAEVTGGGAKCTTTEQEGNIVVDCPVGPLAVGASASVVITLDTSALTVTAFSNTGYVGSGALDDSLSDNDATARVELGPPLVSPPPPPPPGGGVLPGGGVVPGGGASPAAPSPAGTGSSGLSETGVDVGVSVLAALAAVLLGAWALIEARRRRLVSVPGRARSSAARRTRAERWR